MKIPVAVWQGTIELFGIKVTVAVLEDGRRIIEKKSMEALVAYIFSPEKKLSQEDAEQLAKLAKGKGIPT
jgi:hypothetical protein